MKETIYTIPVNDAYAAGGECPLCSLQMTLDQQLLEYYLGPALMEPDVRKTTNAKGFCREHLQALYASEANRLGFGLTLHTHLRDLNADLLPMLDEAAAVGRRTLLSGREKDYRGKLAAAARRISAREADCVICERLNQTMERYLDVIFYQYFHDSAFQETFDHGPGYCLPHLGLLIEGASRHLSQNQVSVFMPALASLQRRCQETLTDDVEWYTLKFDYRNSDKGWKNSKDALPRTIRRLSGNFERKPAK